MESSNNEGKGQTETKYGDTVIDLKAHVDSTDSGKLLFSYFIYWYQIVKVVLKLFLMRILKNYVSYKYSRLLHRL